MEQKNSFDLYKEHGIPRSAIRGMFSDCQIANISSDAIDHFEDQETYLYSARMCAMTGESPLMSIIEKFKKLGCYDGSWEYLLKISINRSTKIDTRDCFNMVCFFEDLQDCIGFNIAIDYDDTLNEGEVKVFQVHFYWDDMGAFLDDSFKQSILPNGSVRDVQEALMQYSA